jgi:hypothetical protein
MATGTRLVKADCPSTPEEIEMMKRIPYQSAIGAIMYAMLGTRPDIAFAVTCLSQFCSNPGMTHWQAVKRLLRYLQGSLDTRLTYSGPVGELSCIPPIGSTLVGYCDADWASDLNDRRSISGYVFLLAGGAVSWQSKKQTTVALSSVEAEYMAMTQAGKEALWWRTFFEQLAQPITQPVTVHADNQGAIALSKNPAYHSRTKHIDIRYHFIRQHVSENKVSFPYVRTEQMAADGFTKPVPKDRHKELNRLIGLSSPSGSVVD